MDQKLQKVLANMGYGSRREIESWIFDGRIRLNNSVAKVGDRVSNKDLIYLDGNKIEAAKIFRTQVIIYNKPEGEISSNEDPKGRPTVFDNLPSLKRAKWISVGRLDINTTGLLLFTTNGELANRLMHPRYQVERKYLVRVFGDVNQSDIDILKKGVLLDDEQAKFKTIERNKGASDGEKRLNNWFKVTLEGGKNREVRRLWESQGFEISRLKRIAYGPIELQPFIRPGNYLELSIEEVQKLGASVDLAISFRGMRDERDNQARDERKLRSRGTRSRKR
jgi:23S rRNA pseudouridine2605 synthase|tara:strand:- start:1186 stop:2022 length:837 start_codon:yes stop_codon:yes gene_type:complete